MIETVAGAKRKTFAAREDLLNRLREVAKQRGFSLYYMVNEIFQLALQAEERGVNLGRIIEERWFLKEAWKTGFILGLENLWYDMAELAYKKARGKALKSWFESGVWLAKRYATGEVQDPLEAFKRDLEAFTWNASEFTIEKEENEISIRIISPRFPLSYTVLLASFLEGALETFNYEIVSRNISKGNIRLEAVEKGAHA